MAVGELESVEDLLRAFYRLVGTTTADDGLMENGEAADEVAYQYLTRGVRAAQAWLADYGLADWWRARSSAITLADWQGSDDADGGRYIVLENYAPDFLRLWGDPLHPEVSALNEADGRAWGREIPEERSRAIGGNFYYLRGPRLWIVRGANPPGTLYIEYYKRHPAINEELDDAAIDFPVDARPLIVAFAANAAKTEGWLPGGPEMEAKIREALAEAKQEPGGFSGGTANPSE